MENIYEDIGFCEIKLITNTMVNMKINTQAHEML